MKKNLRQLYIILHYLHYFMFVLIFRNVYDSTLRGTKLFLILFSITYFTSLYFYSLACKPPGSPPAADSERGENIKGHICEFCNCLKPPRTSHCRTCNSCILRRDHHCPWTGHCIGRDNHLNFFIFTVFEAISDTTALISLIKITNFIFHTKKQTLTLSIFIIYLLPWAIYTSYFSINMVFTNLRNISMNETIWEQQKRDSIWYLKPFPQHYHPFDKGITQNFIEFFTMKKKKLLYQTPTFHY